MRKSLIATGKHARELREWAKERGLEKGDDLFFIAQSLAFLIYDTHASEIALALRNPASRFALRKIKSALSILDQGFFANVDAEPASDSDG
jgi:hypothetical protein